MRSGGTRAGAYDGLGCPVAPIGASAATMGPSWPPPGFRHIFAPDLAAPGTPAPVDRATRERLGRLARCMATADPHDAAGDNPVIPAGYTYFMQFVAHDIVRTETPFWGIGRIADGTRDLAAGRLRLDGLYGGGPVYCPFAYASGGRAALRIAPLAPDPADAGAPPPLRDIPRARFDPPPRGWPANRPPPLDEALLADVRNDDNSNVSQVTVLFAAFHNAVVAALAAAGVKPGLLYTTARSAVTLVYRRILREDLLRRLLHPAVHAAYTAPGAVFLDGGEAGMPLEFSCGAWRCGHAMVRETYRINDGPERDLDAILRATSGGGAGAMPLSRAWAIRWSHFFDMGDAALPSPGASRRLRPQHSPGLLDTRFFDAVDETGKAGLIYRDLLTDPLAGLQPVAALWAHVAARRPDLAATAAFAGEARRHAALHAWMTAAGLDDDDAEALSAAPPLAFYVLFEAEQEGQGQHLGTLGSVLVAETMLGILTRDPLPTEAGDGETAALGRLAAMAGVDAKLLAPLAAIADMPGLVRFAAGAPGINAASPAFI